MRAIGFPLIVSLVLMASCQERGREADTARAPAVTDTEAFCHEHGVLEAVCPKCNPRLAAVFQARGDWCAAHGFPESFCPQCHPEQGGRPSASVGGDEAPAEGLKIRFRSKETAAQAGIETVPAVAAAQGTGLVAVARIAYDATRVAHVNARAAGVVRAIQADIGARVQRGAVLATIESPGVGAEQARLRAAETRVAVARANYERANDLLQKGIGTARDAQLEQQELDEAIADLEATRRALHLVGTSSDDGTYQLVAPLAGIVTQRSVSIGTFVEIGTALFEIVDPTSMWAEIDVQEAHLARLHVGQSVVVRVDALGAQGFSGRIEYIAPAIDPKTRTALARTRLDNPDGLLRAHMFGRAEILVDGEHTGVAVPRDAVQTAKGVDVVFVRLSEGVYETRRVRLGPRAGDWIELAGAIRPGDPVVTTGSFLLKTETLKGSIGAGCCEVEPR